MTINSKTKYYFDKSQINSGQFEGLQLSSSLFKVDEIEKRIGRSISSARYRKNEMKAKSNVTRARKLHHPSPFELFTETQLEIFFPPIFRNQTSA